MIIRHSFAIPVITDGARSEIGENRRPPALCLGWIGAGLAPLKSI